MTDKQEVDLVAREDADIEDREFEMLEQRIKQAGGDVMEIVLGGLDGN